MACSPSPPGELAADKTPVVPSRTALPALAGRAATGGLSGRAVAGLPGAAAGAAAAVAGTYASGRARSLIVEKTGLADPVVAVGEDILAYALAAVATRTISRDEPDDPGAEPLSDQPAAPPRSPLRDALAGLNAGLAGTAAMTMAQNALLAATGGEASTAPAAAADTIKRRLGRGRLRRRHRPAANVGMHWLYGASWGIPYGIVATGASTPPEISGPVFGLIVWGAGLVQQPALGVAEVPWKRSISSLASEALIHVVYGLGAGAMLRVGAPPRLTRTARANESGRRDGAPAARDAGVDLANPRVKIDASGGFAPRLHQHAGPGWGPKTALNRPRPTQIGRMFDCRTN